MVYQIFPLSDESITFSFGNELNIRFSHKLVAMKTWIESAGLPGIRDIIIAYSSITIHYDFYVVRKRTSASPFNFFHAALSDAFERSVSTEQSIRTWQIPVCYVGDYAPDLAHVAAEKNLSTREVVDIHITKIYHVFMIGFLPGFPYLAEVDATIRIDRKQTPVAVAKGSVGLAGKQTGIYPVDSPGGWQIIGRTPLELFKADRKSPVEIQIGDAIKFYEISKDEYNEIATRR